MENTFTPQVCNVPVKRDASTLKLELKGVSTSYGEVQVLKGVDLSVHSGEVVAILGSNGAGKTTLLRSLTGLIKARQGSIEFMGERIEKLPAHRVIKTGIASVPEGRELFGPMSVLDNLLLGTFSLNAKKRGELTGTRLEMVYSLFPILKEKQRQRTDTLSGGQQQMVAIGRALMANPALLALDEPSLGLSPLLVSEVMAALRKICREWGVSLLLVEQNARAALKIADHVYVLERGQVVLHGTCGEVSQSEEIQRAYLGG